MHDINKIARLYDSGLSQKEIGQIIGVGQVQVARIMRKHGISARRLGPRRKYTLNEGFFEDMATAEQAYWLGFLAADGNIGDDGRAVRLQLAECDTEHVRMFVRALGSNSLVTHRPGDRAAVGRVHSARLARTLAPLGVGRNKTYHCQPWDGPAELMPHYWRGFLDGDGHISRTEAALAFIGTRPVMDAFLRFAHGICGTSAKPALPYSGSPVWTVRLMGRLQVPKVVQATYGIGGPVLARKHIAAMELIARYPKPVPKKCKAEGEDCPRTPVARGLCGKHIQRYYAYGDTHTAGGPGRDSDTGRFVPSVIPDRRRRYVGKRGRTTQLLLPGIDAETAA